MADFDDERPADPDEWRREAPRHDGTPVPTRQSTARGAWRAAAWLFLVTATGTLVAGIAVGQGLLIATGLVLAGIAGHLFTPEYAENRNRSPRSPRQQLYLVLLIGGMVLPASIAAARAATRLGLPSLLLFLAVGVITGEDALGLEFDDAQLAQALGTAALAVILVEGGLTTQWADVKRLLAPAGVLAGVGVAVSVAVTATGAHLLLGLEWHLALLLGAIISSTDAAATFAVLRSLPLPHKVTGLLEAESGFNDAPTIILVMVFSTAVTGMPSPAAIAGSVLYQLAVGAAFGLIIGRAGAFALRHIALPATGLYPLTTVGFGIIAFAAAGAVNASGIIAAYLAGLVLGNAKLPHRAATTSFAEGAGWLAHIGLFVMLGLLVTPSELPSAVLTALGVGLILLLIARRLGLTRPGALRDVEVEAAPLDVLDADLLTVAVPPGSRLHGVAVFELRLPPPAVVTLLVRDGSAACPVRTPCSVPATSCS